MERDLALPTTGRSRWVRLLAVVAVVAPGLALGATAHVDAAADVPFSETPSATWGANGRVRAIASVGNLALIGGHFTALTSPNGSQSVSRAYLAAIDTTTGAPTSWSPNANNRVWSMVAAPSGKSVFVGGQFTTINGQTRKRVAEISLSTGQPTSFSVNVPAGVRALALSPDGSTLYIGGVFKKINGVSQAYLAAVRTSDGSLVESFRPTVAQVAGPCPPRCKPEVASLDFNGDASVLYFGGHFGSVDGAGRNNAAAARTVDGSLTQWNPNVFEADPNNPNQRNLVNGITVSTNPGRVIVCGDFWRVGGAASPNLAAVDPVTGAKQNWIATTDGGTPDCVARDGILYVGGHFQKVGGRIAKTDGVPRNHIAAIDLGTAEVLPWDPSANSVLGLHDIHLGVSADGDLMVGGDFTRIGGRRQHRFAVFERIGSTSSAPGDEFSFAGSGSATTNSWQEFDFPVSSGDEVEVTLSWVNPDAEINLFLRDDSGDTVAHDNSGAGSPKVVGATAPNEGDWSAAIKIKTGASEFDLAVAVS